MSNKGTALILVTVLLISLAIFSTALISSSFSENVFAIRNLEATQAFWLAEAGISRAINDLRTNPNLTAIAATALGKGGYSVPTITYDSGTGTYTVTAYGFIPSNPSQPLNPPYRAERRIQAVIAKLTLPEYFDDYVIWSATNILIKGTGEGNYASINGNVISYGDTSTRPAATPPENVIIGELSEEDDRASPLPLFNFNYLRDISKDQIHGDGSNNYYDAARLQGNPSFPTSFWYDETNKVPNVVFLEGNLVLAGNVNVGGFFIVGGGYVGTTTVTGTVDVDGCIYTPGVLEIKGGGASLNIDGGVWAGGVLLNGSMTLTYNPEYMGAIKNEGYDTTMQFVSWLDLQNPYTLIN